MGRGYVLRRIIRRAVRYGSRLGHKAPFTRALLPALAELLKDPLAFPQLHDSMPPNLAAAAGAGAGAGAAAGARAKEQPSSSSSSSNSGNTNNSNSLFSFVADVLEQEERLFFGTLLRGVRMIEEAIAKEEEASSAAAASLAAATIGEGAKKQKLKADEKAKMKKEKEISGALAFLLYDSFGFPLDLTVIIAKEKG